MMIHRDGFLKGDQVDFQDNRHVWRRGTVQHVEWAETTITGPSGAQIVEKKPTHIHVLVSDSFARTTRIFVLPKKRVRAVPHDTRTA
jgi:hypothetical protein